MKDGGALLLLLGILNLNHMTGGVAVDMWLGYILYEADAKVGWDFCFFGIVVLSWFMRLLVTLKTYSQRIYVGVRVNSFGGKSRAPSVGAPSTMRGLIFLASSSFLPLPCPEILFLQKGISAWVIRTAS